MRRAGAALVWRCGGLPCTRWWAGRCGRRCGGPASQIASLPAGGPQFAPQVAAIDCSRSVPPALRRPACPPACSKPRVSQLAVDALSGAVGEVASLVVLYPLDSLKVLCQARGASTGAVLAELRALGCSGRALRQLYAGCGSAAALLRRNWCHVPADLLFSKAAGHGNAGLRRGPPAAAAAAAIQQQRGAAAARQQRQGLAAARGQRHRAPTCCPQQRGHPPAGGFPSRRGGFPGRIRL